MRRKVTQTEIERLRNNLVQHTDGDEIAVIVRKVVDPGQADEPYTDDELALIEQARLDFEKDGKIRRLVLRGDEP